MVCLECATSNKFFVGWQKSQIVAQVTHANIRDSSGNPMISFHRLTRFMHKTLSSRWVNTPLEHTHAHSLYLSLELLFMDARRLEYFISSRHEPKEADAEKIKYEIQHAFLLFFSKKELLLSMRTYISKTGRTHFEFFLASTERVEVNDEPVRIFIPSHSPVLLLYLIF